MHLTAGRLAHLLGDWRSGPGPIHATLTRRLAQLLFDGRVAPGVRLPAERPLAGQLGVSRTTVVRVYTSLRDQGMLESRRGAGSFSRLPAAPGRRYVPWSSASAAAHEELIDLTKASPRADPELATVLEEAAAQAPALLDHHGYHPLGVEELRAAVAARYERRGLPTSPAQILITAGAQQAIDLVVRSLIRRRETVVVESPTYPGAIDSLRAAGANLVTHDLSCRPWDVDELDVLIGQTGARMAYLMPDFQNPTGRLMGATERRRLVDVCRERDVTLLVDETLAELALDGDPPPRPVAACADEAAVISVGSLSKVVWAGLRVGWVRAAPHTIRALASVRATASLGGAPLEQLAAASVLPRLDEFVARLGPRLRSQRDALLASIRELGWRVTTPRGGLSCWAELPAGSSSLLADLAAARGVVLMPGPRVSPDGLLDRFVRLPFALPVPVLDAAMAELRECLPALSPRR